MSGKPQSAPPATPKIPSVSVRYAGDGSSTRSNNMGMRPMQERVWQKRGEQYLLIKSPPASGKSRALMFVALDKLHNQKLRQAIIVVPEKSIGASFHDELLTQFGFFADWKVEPRWNLCDAPGGDNGGNSRPGTVFISSFVPLPARGDSVGMASARPDFYGLKILPESEIEK